MCRRRFSDDQAAFACGMPRSVKQRLREARQLGVARATPSRPGVGRDVRRAIVRRWPDLMETAAAAAMDVALLPCSEAAARSMQRCSASPRC
jgi:hypothetical protein